MGSNAEPKEDRISVLPDSIVQRILSFLPSTKESIQTSVLSKRWQEQWTHVPVLIFDLSGFSDEEGMDTTLILHDCSKIKKFHIKCHKSTAQDSNYNAKLRFAIRKEVEELVLNFCCQNKINLPNFFFNNTSLIILHLTDCNLIPNGRSVNWERLKDLYIKSCFLPTQAIESIVVGSPLLESLEINSCSGFDRLAIPSKSLKRLVLVDPAQEFVLEISCSNLIEFSAVTSNSCASFSFSDEQIEEVLSGNPSLQLLKLIYCYEFKRLVIDSNSLKKLVLVEIAATDAIVISCPNLQEFHFYSWDVATIQLINMPPSICATIDLNCYRVYTANENLGRKLLEQLHHVKELNIGRCFIKILAGYEMRGLSSPLIRGKCLTLDGGPNILANVPGIAYALRCFGELEKLVIILRHLDVSFVGINFNFKPYVFVSMYMYLQVSMFHDFSYV